MPIDRVLIVAVAVASLFVVLTPGPGVLLRSLLGGATAALLVWYWDWAHAIPARRSVRRWIFLLAAITIALCYTEAMVRIWMRTD